jgi:hypothetical protein
MDNLYFQIQVEFEPLYCHGLQDGQYMELVYQFPVQIGRDGVSVSCVQNWGNGGRKVRVGPREALFVMLQ